MGFPRALSRTFLAAVLAATSSCLHYPGEPYMDVVATPTKREEAIVSARYPDAEFIGPIYRRHRDTRLGYQVASHVFLFRDKRGNLYRGSIDRAELLTTSPATYVSKLPSHLHSRFFDGSSALAPGGRLDGRAWIFNAPESLYEFRHDSPGGPGFGRISEAGHTMFAYPLR